MHRIMSLQAMSLLFQFGFFLLSFYLYITMARTSKTISNGHSESGHSCLITDLRKCFQFFFFPLKMLFTLDLSYIAFIILRYVSSMPTIWRAFIINGYQILSKAFPTYFEIIICFLSFSLLMWCITLIDLGLLKNLCILAIVCSFSC